MKAPRILDYSGSKWSLADLIISYMPRYFFCHKVLYNKEERWFATARTATKHENMQGFHEDYMLFIVDEASGVSDPIWKQFWVLCPMHKINC